MRVSLTEFKNNPLVFFRMLEQGDFLEVTRHGKVIASFTSTGQEVAVRNSDILANTGLKRQASLPYFGLFSEGGVWTDLGTQPFKDFKRKTGYLSMVHWFVPFTSKRSGQLIRMKDTNIRTVIKDGFFPVISWEPSEDAETPANIAFGFYDDFLKSWAEDIVREKIVLALRPFPEMNGDWTKWHGDPQTLKAAWQHMVDIFDAAGAKNNVIWVWSPNITSHPNEEWNDFKNYYPGDAYVNVLALDGYNRGDTIKNGVHYEWQNFDEVFADAYTKLQNLSAGSQLKPFWVAETGSVEQNNQRSAWLLSMLNSHAFPKLEAILYFDHREGSAGFNYSIRDDPQALSALKQGHQDIIV